jgi:O-antigen/teichoic acid export membrane protein
MTTAQRLTSNVLYQFGCQSLLLVLSFAFSPYVVHRLGVDLYGLLILAGLTTNYFAIVELGLGQATVKFVADAYARNDSAGLRRIFWTSALTYFALSVLGAVALAAITPWLTHILRVPKAFIGLTEQVFYISALGLVVSMMGGIVSSVPRALERFDLVTFLSIPVGAGQLALNVLLLYIGCSLSALVLGGVVVQTIALMAYILVARNLLPCLGGPTWDQSAFRQLLRFGGLVSISQVVGPILTHIEKFIIGSVLTLSAVAFYSVPYNLVWAFTIIPGSISGVLFPTFSRLTVEGNPRRRSHLFLRSTKYVFVAILPIALAVALFSQRLLTAWMGPDLALESGAVLQILAFAVVINSIAAPAYQALQAIGRPGIPAKFHVLEVCLHVPICYFLIVHYGVVGGAIAWLTRVTLDTLLLTVAFTRLSGIPYRIFLSRSLLRPALAAFALFPGVCAAAYLLPAMKRVETLLAIAAVGAIYWVAVFALTTDDDDKRSLAMLTARWLHWPGLMPAAAPPVKST